MKNKRYAFLKGGKHIHRLEIGLNQKEYEALEALMNGADCSESNWITYYLKKAGFEVHMDEENLYTIDICDRFDNGALVLLSLSWCKKDGGWRSNECPVCFIYSADDGDVFDSQDYEGAIASSESLMNPFSIDFGDAAVRAILESSMVGDMGIMLWNTFREECPFAYSDIIRGDAFEIQFVLRE